MTFQKLLARMHRAAVLLPTLCLLPTAARAQGTAFTYQGRLDFAGAPAGGTHDLTFTLYNAAGAGATVGTSNVFNDLVLSNGLFTVALDFGSGAFDGNARWLQIAVRPGVSTGAYTNLAPRQSVTATPYAMFAGGAAAAGITGKLPSAGLSGTYSGVVNFSNAGNSFAGNGRGLTNISTTNLVGTVADARLSANVALRSGGNTFIGTQVITNGNVGIGTVSPVAQLDVRGPFVGGIALGDWNGTNSRYIGIIPPGVSTNIAAGSGFSGVEFGGPAANPNSGMIAFHTHSYGFGSSEKMRIDRAGNVGIGTSNPLFPLQVRAGVNQNFVVEPGSNIGVPGTVSLRGVNDANTENVPISLFGSPIALLGGNVGIGTATPNASLQVMTAYNYPTPAVSLAGAVPELTLSLQNTSAAGRNWAVLSSGTGSGLPGALRFFDMTAGADRMVIRTNGNVGIGTLTPATRLDVGGEVTCVAVNITSDRDAKEDFKPVNVREVLARVGRLPITEWQYKTQGDARHIGPMAQDFHAAFGTGRDDRHITSVDADGVALAAIQGLHQLVQEKDAELGRLKTENQSLAARLAAIERALGLAAAPAPLTSGTRD